MKSLNWWQRTYLKFKQWVQQVHKFFQTWLKRQTFDNKLFKLGVDKITNILIEQYKKTGLDKDDLWTSLSNKLLVEFNHIPVVKKHLLSILNTIKKKNSKEKTFISKTIPNKIRTIAQELIKWYDEYY